jgi:peroxiredoxin Q/BCP
MAAGVRVGDVAPDFDLDGTDGRFRLSEHRGERVVLLFYPGDETPVCTRQFCSYAAREDELAQLDATVVGISGQDVASHVAFQRAHDIPVPLLADPDREVAHAYGVARRVFGTQRAVFIVDEAGIVRYRHVHTLSLDYENVDELREALERVRAEAPATKG